jgi:hypothetical protein
VNQHGVSGDVSQRIIGKQEIRCEKDENAIIGSKVIVVSIGFTPDVNLNVNGMRCQHHCQTRRRATKRRPDRRREKRKYHLKARALWFHGMASRVPDFKYHITRDSLHQDDSKITGW